jgi:hypothetical protein
MISGKLSPVPVAQDRTPATAGVPTDRQLLARFAPIGDGPAFEVLMHRYGPLVLGVCRRVLGDATDAEAAFQALVRFCFGSSRSKF